MSRLRLLLGARAALTPPPDPGEYATAEVSAAWIANNGAPDSGFTVVPDPAADAAARALADSKPQIVVNAAHWIDRVMLTDDYAIAVVEKWTGVSGAAHDEVEGVQFLFENDDGPVVTARQDYTDEFGKEYHQFICKLIRPSSHLGPVPPSSGGGSQANLYLRGIPKDPDAYDSRVVGPFKTFPADESRVVRPTLRKDGAGTYTTLVNFWNGALAEYNSTGKFFIGEVTQTGQNWLCGRATQSHAIPAYIECRMGLDTVTGEPCTAILGDPASFPTQSYSSPGLDHIAFVDWKIDIGLTGPLVPRENGWNNIALINCEVYCSSFPASATITSGTYPIYGTGTGQSALIRGRQPGPWLDPATDDTGRFILINCHVHDVPSYGIYCGFIVRGNIFRNISGSVIQNQLGAAIGNQVSRFGGFYSGLLTKEGDPNPGMALTYNGADAWWGFKRTESTGSNGEFSLWTGASQATATLFHAAWTTEAFKSVAELVAEINTDTAGAFTAVDETTDDAKLDCTHLSLPVLSAASPIQQGDYAYPGSGTMHLNVIVDIHANGYVHNRATTIANLAVIDNEFYEYCGAAPISGSSAVSQGYDDMVIRGNTWRPDDGYTDRNDDFQLVGREGGYCTGFHDSWQFVLNTMLNGAGIQFGDPPTSPYKGQIDSGLYSSYGAFGECPTDLIVMGCVSPSNFIPAHATNSKSLGSVGVVFPDSSVFTDAVARDYTVKAATTYAVTPDGVNIAGAFNFTEKQPT